MGEILGLWLPLGLHWMLRLLWPFAVSRIAREARIAIGGTAATIWVRYIRSSIGPGARIEWCLWPPIIAIDRLADGRSALHHVRGLA